MSHPNPTRTAAKFAEASDTRCAQCKWVHEVDSTAGKSFMGVELCPLHAAAPELLEVAQTVAAWLSYGVPNPRKDQLRKQLEDAITHATPPDAWVKRFFGWNTLTQERYSCKTSR